MPSLPAENIGGYYPKQPELWMKTLHTHLWRYGDLENSCIISLCFLSFPDQLWKFDMSWISVLLLTAIFLHGPVTPLSSPQCLTDLSTDTAELWTAAFLQWHINSLSSMRWTRCMSSKMGKDQQDFIEAFMVALEDNRVFKTTGWVVLTTSKGIPSPHRHH